MRASHPLVLAAAALLAAAFAAPPATGQASSDAKTGAGGTRPTTRPAKAKTSTQPAKRKVWTNADLVALRNDPSARVQVLESKRHGGPSPKLRIQPSVRPQDVVDRYAELAKEAEAKLAELGKEKLAASNPYLRGLASKTGGPRTPAEIEADLARWTSRRDTAKSNLERAQKLTGARPGDADPR